MSTHWRRTVGASGAAGALLALLCAAAPLRAQNGPPPAPRAAAPAAQPKTPPPSDNAFPEAESRAAEKAANAADDAASDGPADTAGTVPESSSRSRMKGMDLLGDHDSRASDGAGGMVHDPKLAKEDIRVGQLYMADGNYPGAYSRFKEATAVAPGNADAVFYLAEAARKTSHLDEAATNYKLYLEADPKGKRAKDAKKALTELAGK